MVRLQQGLTLIELMISVALSLSMMLVLIQLHLQSSHMSDQQQALGRQLESIAALQHLLGHSVRDALYNISLSTGGEDSSASDWSRMFHNNCAGVSVHEQCVAPVMSWTAGANGAPDIAAAVTDSGILQIKQSCCPGIVADQFYLAHRGGDPTNPLSLYRRRLQTDGSYTVAVELVEGVTRLSVGVIVENHIMGGLALIDSTQVENWWQLKGVRIRAGIQGVAMADAAKDISFTIASRQWQQMPGASDVKSGTSDAVL